MGANLPLIIGSVMVGIGITSFLYQYIKQIYCKVEVEGTARILFRKIMGTDMPYPALTYTVNGVEYTKPFSGDSSISESVMRGGTGSVTVVYNPAKPKQHYILENASGSKIITSVLLCLGPIFIIAGISARSPDITTIEAAARAAAFFVGLFFVGVVFATWRREKNLRQICTAQTAGIVSDMIEKRSSRQGKLRVSYRPEFTYSVEGIKFVQLSRGTFSSSRFSKGQGVTVLYDPSKPRRYYVLEEGKQSIAIFVVLACCVSLMIFASVSSIVYFL